MVSKLKVRYDLIDNLQTSLKDERKNEGAVDITAGDWALYLCFMRMIEHENTAHCSQGNDLPGGQGISVTHINGCLFKFEPNRDFQMMKHNGSLVPVFKAGVHM